MKNKLKTEMGERRNSLSRQDILERSRKIESTLKKIKGYASARTAMFFVSFGSEVFTHIMIKDALKSKTVCVPKIYQRSMEPSIILDLDSLVPSGPFAIPEPIELMKIAYKSIDVVLVPGLAFDKEGYRLGYGYGFYDVFLRKVPKALKIGLAFDFQIVDKVPREGHDVPVDIIVTEERIVECRK